MEIPNPQCGTPISAQIGLKYAVMKNILTIILFLAGGLSLSAQERTITWTTDPVDDRGLNVGNLKILK